MICYICYGWNRSNFKACSRCRYFEALRFRAMRASLPPRCVRLDALRSKYGPVEVFL